MSPTDKLEEVIAFLDRLFVLERRALDAKRLDDPDPYNALYEQLAGLATDPGIRFHLARRHGPLTDFERQMYTLVPADNRARHLYLVQEYAWREGRSVYAAYCSAPNPPDSVLVYSECLWVVETEDGFRVAAYHLFDDLDRPEPVWKFAAGNPELDFEKLGDPIRSKRLLAPKDDPFALQHYNAAP